MSQALLSKILDFTHESIVLQNISKLYALMYPLMIADFRHREDCRTAMSIMDTHIHMHTDSTIISSVQLPTQPPLTPSAVNETIALSLVGTDTQFPGLPTKIVASVVVKPFEVV